MELVWAILIALFVGICIGFGGALYWVERSSSEARSADVIINGKPGWKVGIWSEHHDVSVYVVHEGFGAWGVWSCQDGVDLYVRVGRSTSPNRADAERVAYRNGVIRTKAMG